MASVVQDQPELVQPRSRVEWVVAAAGAVLIALLVLQVYRFKRGRDVENCAFCLHAIGLMVERYANANQGNCPPTFDELILSPAVTDFNGDYFICPASADERLRGDSSDPAFRARLIQSVKSPSPPYNVSYVYAGGGLKGIGASDAIVAYEPIGNHATGCNVLFGDGSVRLLETDRFHRVLAELQSGHNPPRAEKLK